MSKELDALSRIVGCSTIESHRPKWQKDYKLIETALKDYEMEHTLRIRLENINYELVREKQKNDKELKALEIIKDFAPLITINIKGKEYDIKANNTSDIALYAELYINDRLIYSTMNRDKIEKLYFLREILK